MKQLERLGDSVERIHKVVVSRKGGDPSISYTARLLEEGTERIAAKLGEEAVETVVAAVAQDRQALIAESVDLIYHLLVLWADAEISPDEVAAELTRREGVSGIAEKASRGERG